MQTQHDIAPHIEKLNRALGEKGKDISPEDLEAEFRKYLEYGVPVPEAIRTILRHYGAEPPADMVAGGSGDEGGSGDRVLIDDLPGNAPAVNVKVRLITLNTKTITARGEKKDILWGLVGDESGTCAYTSWRPLEGLDKGDVVEVRGAYTKTWRDEVQLNFGDRCRIEALERDAIPKVEVKTTDKTVAELQDGTRNFSVTGRVLELNERTVNVKGEEKTIYGGNLADTTGKIEFTAWEDVGLKEGQVVTISGGYVRSYQGTPQLNFDGGATITEADADLPDAEELDDVPVMDVGDLLDQGGSNDVKVQGTLLEIRPGSGLVFRDPETNRVLQPGQKAADGSEGKPDLRIKGILDDGTGAVQFVVGKDITEGLLGKGIDACLDEAREAFRHEVIQDQLQEKLTGRNFEVRGFARSDEYGTMLIGRSLKDVKVDVPAEAKVILEGLPEPPKLDEAPPAVAPATDAPAGNDAPAETDAPEADVVQADAEDAAPESDDKPEVDA